VKGTTCAPDNDTCTTDVCNGEGSCTHTKNSSLPNCGPTNPTHIILAIVVTCGGVTVVVAGGAVGIIALKGADMANWIEFTHGAGDPVGNPLYSLPSHQGGAHTMNPMFRG